MFKKTGITTTLGVVKDSTDKNDNKTKVESDKNKEQPSDKK